MERETEDKLIWRAEERRGEKYRVESGGKGLERRAKGESFGEGKGREREKEGEGGLWFSWEHSLARLHGAHQAWSGLEPHAGPGILGINQPLTLIPMLQL